MGDELIELAGERVGGSVVAAGDEFFAAKENLLFEAAPRWREGAFTERGKWMDGWETRRRRVVGPESHDWCVVRLGLPGVVQRVVVDTTHFTGNFPTSCALDATGSEPAEDPTGQDWVEILPRLDLQGDAINEFDVGDPHRATMVRLRIYPDGGVARLRLLGRPLPGLSQVVPAGGPPNLAALGLGAQVVAASDSYFASPDHVLRPTRPAGMFDGWENRRRRDGGHDWLVVRLGLPGVVERVLVDTSYFVGNAPGEVTVEVSADGRDWEEVVERVPVDADRINLLEARETAPAQQLRLNVYPDGGVTRLHVYGRPDPAALASARIDYLNALFESAARAFFATSCAASAFVTPMVAGRPYADGGEVLSAAEAVWPRLGEEDWLEAFAAHPRIGGRGGTQTREGQQMSTQEQAGVAEEGAIADDLAGVNDEYEQRFGFTYIVYASGRTGRELLELARARLDNDRATELATAAAEQRRITIGRLRRLLCLGEE